MKQFNFILILLILNCLSLNAHTLADDDSLKTINLADVVIKAQTKRHHVNSDVYYIDADKCKGTITIYDLLEKIPGVDYNKFSNTLSVFRDKNIKVEVNGTPASNDYLLALSPNRISKVEIVRVPSAKYTLSGCKYLIRIKLRDDYEGSALSLNNFMMLSPNNGENLIANEQPKVRYLYSNKTFDANVGYGMATIHWNYPIMFSKEYVGIISQQTNDYTHKNPNESNGNQTHFVDANLNWRIGNGQSLFFSGSYEWISKYQQQVFSGTESLYDSSDNLFDEKIEEVDKTSDVKSYLIYKNSLWKNLKVQASIGCDFLSGTQRNSFSEKTESLSSGDYKNIKQFLHGELDFLYQLTEALSLNFGYLGTLCNYKVEDKLTKLRITKNDNNLHNIYLYMDYALSDKFLVHAGMGLGNVFQKSIEAKWNKWKPLPQLTLSYVPNEVVQLSVDYQAKMESPKLYQLSASESRVDAWMKLRGNPNLLASTNHSVTLLGSFWDKLQVGFQYEYEKNGIVGQYVKESNENFIQSYTNANAQNFGAWMAYDWEICKNLTWQNTISLQFLKIKSVDTDNNTKNLSYISTLDWWYNKLKTNVSLEYRREMIKNPTLYGWEQFGQDLWQVAINKSLWRNRINLSLMYVPPFRFGIRENQSVMVKTDFMQLKRCQPLRSYDNTFLLRVRFNLDNRKKIHRSANEFMFVDEKSKGKGLL